jgi:hypothetical protein
MLHSGMKVSEYLFYRHCIRALHPPTPQPHAASSSGTASSPPQLGEALHQVLLDRVPEHAGALKTIARHGFRVHRQRRVHAGQPRGNRNRRKTSHRPWRHHLRLRLSRHSRPLGGATQGIGNDDSCCPLSSEGAAPHTGTSNHENIWSAVLRFLCTFLCTLLTAAFERRDLRQQLLHRGPFPRPVVRAPLRDAGQHLLGPYDPARASAWPCRSSQSIPPPPAPASPRAAPAG